VGITFSEFVRKFNRDQIFLLDRTKLWAESYQQKFPEKLPELEA
jgi:hypothetical protein